MKTMAAKRGTMTAAVSQSKTTTNQVNLKRAKRREHHPRSAPTRLLGMKEIMEWQEDGRSEVSGLSGTG